MAATENGARGVAPKILTLLLGVLLGAALGSYVGWVAWPTEYTDADPTILQADYQYDYALMTAHAYAIDGNLAQARTRLAALGDDPEHEWYLALTLDAILAGRSPADVRALAQLAQALGVNAPALAPYLAPEAPS